MAPGPNGSFTDVLDNSVVKFDAELFRDRPGLMFFALPAYGFYNYGGALPPEPPAYWSFARDIVLRASVLHESLWGSAVAIAGTKAAALSWEVDGEGNQRLKRAQDLMLALDGRGWVPGMAKGVRDYTTTDNGEWWEIVRASGAAGSRILGLMHLDSVRCVRTGDPERPIVYRDLVGAYHELRDYQLIELVDSPNPGAEWLGVGQCAAARAYQHIYKMAGIERYVSEKIHGDKFLEIHFVNGINDKMLNNALQAAKEGQTQQGYVAYQGAAVIPMFGDKPVSGYRVPIAELPDKFNRKEEFDLAVIAYADAIGLDPQDLQPLSGQGLGTGAQSYVLSEKAKGKGLAARQKQWVHEVNLKVLPDGVTFAFSERDLRDEKVEADIKLVRAQTRAHQIEAGEITSLEARQLAVDTDDLPKEFLPPEGDQTDEGDLSDSEKPLDEEEAASQQPLPATAVGPAPASAQPAPVAVKSVNEVLREYEDTLDRWVVDAAHGHMDALDVGRAMRALIREKGAEAFREGLREAGVPDVAANLTDDDEAQVDDWIAGQLSYVGPFAKDAAAVHDLAGDAKTAARDAMLRRVEEWATSLQAIGQKGYLSGKGNPMLTFDGPDGKETCVDCQRYKGQRHRRSWWERRGLLDRPNGNFKCGRFKNCAHHFYDQDGRVVMD